MKKKSTINTNTTVNNTSNSVKTPVDKSNNSNAEDKTENYISGDLFPSSSGHKFSE